MPVVSARDSLLLPAKTDCSGVRDKGCDWLAIPNFLIGCSIYGETSLGNPPRVLDFGLVKIIFV